MNLYLQPLTSAASGSVPLIEWQAPDLRKLASFIEEHFTWGHVPGILKHFTDTIFSGLALRELTGATLQQDNRPCPYAPSFSLIDPSRSIIAARRNHSTCSMLELRVGIRISQNIINLIRSGLQGKYSSSEQDAKAAEWIRTKGPHIRAWIPFIVMQTVHPNLVAVFEARHDHGASSSFQGIFLL